VKSFEDDFYLFKDEIAVVGIYIVSYYIQWTGILK